MIYRTTEEEIKAELQEEIPGITDTDAADLLPAVLTRKECAQLIAFYPWGNQDEKRNHLAIRVLYATGVRIAELAALKYCDLDYENRVVFVRSGKGNKDRYCVMDQDTADKLKEYQGSAASSDSVFSLSDRQLRRIIEKAGTETGIAAKYEAMGRIFSPHSFRHAFATHCFENGIRIFSLKKLLGHEFIGTTEIYINTAVNYDILEYDKCNPFMPPIQPEEEERKRQEF